MYSYLYSPTFVSRPMLHTRNVANRCQVPPQKKKQFALYVRDGLYGTTLGRSHSNQSSTWFRIVAKSSCQRNSTGMSRQILLDSLAGDCILSKSTTYCSYTEHWSTGSPQTTVPGTLRWCPYKINSIQVSKFPRAHNQSFFGWIFVTWQ